MGTLRFFAAVLIAAAISAITAPAGAQAQQITPPLSRPQAQYYQQHPQELQQLLSGLSQAAQQFTPGKPLAAGEVPAAGGWTTLTNSPGVAVQNPILMTDGTVIAMRACSGHWYKLTPDNTGSYLNGAWTQIATMPSGYGPLFGGSGVLPDGRVIFEGGEYNNSSQSGSCGSGVWTSLGAIYDPVANAWTNVNPPPFWTTSIFGSPGIGDAAGVVLDNGTYMQSACCYTNGVQGLSALFNPSTLTWTTTGSGKRDPWDEEGMAKMHNGNVLVVDANIAVSCNNAAEIYNASTGTFSATGSTVDQEPDCSNPGNSLSYELGPLVVRQDGSAVIFPGILCSDAANSNCSSQASGFVVTPKIDLYNVGAGTWSTLATMPRLGTSPNNYFYSLADAPAAVLPDGNVLFAASPSYQAFVSPTHFFELNFSSGAITQVGDTADAASGGAYVQNFLLLPTGQVLAVSQLGNMQIYTPLAGSPQSGWAPVITSSPGCVSPGQTYVMSGTQLNGLTEGSYYGDDVNASVNFPVVRIVNNTSTHVFYAKTFNHSSRSIAQNAAVTTSFTVAAATELGASTLYDIGAGIASAGTAITVGTSCAHGLADSHDFNADGKSDVLWRNGTTLAVWLMNGAAISSSGSVNGLPSNWSVVGQRDFDGDGKADLLIRDTSGDIAIWFMNGTAVSSSGGIGTLATNWTVAGVADFDGDGKGDILWRDGAGDIAVWLMNGASVKSSAGLGNLPTATWTVAGTGDFNGDGKADILWRDSSGDIAIWFMNGVTVTSSAPLGNLAISWSVVGTGDFNGDGKSDIVWRDTVGDTAIWLMNGGAVLQAGSLGTISTTYSIAQTGDYNGDGKSDLLWQDTSGDTSIWFMNGVTVSSGAGVGTIAAPWTIQSTNSD
jgi:FG-GAP-like repeat